MPHMKETIRVEPDGTVVYRKNNKIYRRSPATGPAGYYAPYGGRQAFLGGRKDHRNTDMFAQIVRDQRARGVRSGQAIHPGAQ